MVDGLSYEVAYDDDGNVVESYTPPPAPQVGSSLTEATAARLKLVEQAAAPTAEADAALIYALDDAGATKVYVRTTDADVEIGAAGGSSTDLGTVGIGTIHVDSSTGQVSLTDGSAVWKEVQIAPTYIEGDGLCPAQEQWLTDGSGSRGLFVRKFTDEEGGSEKELHFAFEIPYDFDSNAIEIHVHWIGDMSASACGPRWALEYAQQDMGGTFGSTSMSYSDGTNHIGSSGSVDVDVVALRHYVAVLDGPGYVGPGAVVLGRIYRDSGSRDDSYDGGACGLLSVTARYKATSLGDADATF